MNKQIFVFFALATIGINASEQQQKEIGSLSPKMTKQWSSMPVKKQKQLFLSLTKSWPTDIKQQKNATKILETIWQQTPHYFAEPFNYFEDQACTAFHYAVATGDLTLFEQVWPYGGELLTNTKNNGVSPRAIAIARTVDGSDVARKMLNKMNGKK